MPPASRTGLSPYLAAAVLSAAGRAPSVPTQAAAAVTGGILRELRPTFIWLGNREAVKGRLALGGPFREGAAPR